MGVCPCKLGYTGSKCQINKSGYGGNLKNCADGYFGFPTCNECGCDQRGTLNGNKNCDKKTRVPILIGNSIFYVLSFSSIMIYDQSRRLPTINRQRVHIVVSSPKLKRKKSQYLLSR